MKRPLVDAIVSVIGKNRLTYREITNAINHSGCYHPRDGGCVPDAEVRVTIAANPAVFLVERSFHPHLISVREPEHC
jgi:hypothetical protein